MQKISCVFKIYLWYIYGMFMVYLWYVYGMFMVYLWYIWKKTYISTKILDIYILVKLKKNELLININILYK
jgi:hypothetical protein